MLLTRKRTKLILVLPIGIKLTLWCCHMCQVVQSYIQRRLNGCFSHTRTLMENYSYKGLNFEKMDF